MTDLNPYEEGLALELQEAKDCIKALTKERDDYAHKLMQANNTYTEMHLEIERLSDKLAKAVEALDYCINAPFSGWTIAQGYARTTLAEIKVTPAPPSQRSKERTMTDQELKTCLGVAHVEGFEDEAEAAEGYVAALEAKLKAATSALQKIADYAEGNVVKYIQGVDAIACDALDILKEEAKDD